MISPWRRPSSSSSRLVSLVQISCSAAWHHPFQLSGCLHQAGRPLGKLCRLKGYKKQAGPAMQCDILGRAGKHWFSQTCGREAWEQGGTAAAGRDLM